MTIWPYAAAYALLWLAMITIAATIWLEMRYDAQRRRRVRDIESVLAGQQIRPVPEEIFKRVA